MTNSQFSFETVKSSLLANKTFKIVFLGDSITSTEWVHPNWREVVEYVLKNEFENLDDWDWRLSAWGIRCINSGYNGISTEEILQRFNEAVIDHHPDLAIFVEGGASYLKTHTLEKYHQEVDQFIEKVSQNCRYFIFGGSIPTNKKDLNQKLQKYFNLLKSLPKRKNVLMLDLFSEMQKFDLTKFFSFVSPWGNTELDMKQGEIDWVHPNQLGNAYIAKIILEQGFGINFDPEKYIKENLDGKMYPGY